jgi:predicted Zn-dependent protease
MSVRLLARLVVLLVFAHLSCALPLPSPEREARLGAEAARQVAQEIGHVTRPELARYVDALGRRLVASLAEPAFEYHFQVADMAEPNAFALPGGYVYVSRGLLALTNSEAELANVLGHEIGHVVARHGVRRQSRAAGVGLLSILGTVAAAALGGEAAAQTAMQLGRVAGAGLIASYSREQEREADDLGQRLAARSGFDPEGMPAFLRSLERESILRTGERRMPGFLDSHPVTAERIADTSARARALEVTPAPPVAPDRTAFLARIEGILVGPDPAKGVFRGDRFLHPTLDFTWVVPSGWQRVDQPRAVGAVAPGGQAFVALQVQGGPIPPDQAALAWARENRLRLQQGRRMRIHGLDVFHALSVAATQQGEVALSLYWIAHPAATFRLMGAAPAARFGSWAAHFQRAAGTFRRLDRAERDGILERRLAVTRARPGESLEQLSERAGNVWSAEETAVANALPRAVRFSGGEPVKIAVERRFERGAG